MTKTITAIAVAGLLRANRKLPPRIIWLRWCAHADEKRAHLSVPGIAERNFERKFQLAENIHVRGANPVNGLLYIDLERDPEAKNRAVLEIN